MAANVSADRDDNYVTFQPSLSINLRPGLELNLFYLRRQNFSSGREGRGFGDDQAGFSIGYTF